MRYIITKAVNNHSQVGNLEVCLCIRVHKCVYRYVHSHGCMYIYVKNVKATLYKKDNENKTLFINYDESEPTPNQVRIIEQLN